MSPVHGPPYGDSADEQARKDRETQERRRRAEHAWGFGSYPEDEGRQRHQERLRAQGNQPGKGCLDATGRLVAGTVTAVLAARWYWRTRTSSLR